MTIDKEALIGSAAACTPPSLDAAKEFSARREAMTAVVIERLHRRADIEELTGPGNLALMEDNYHNFGRFMAALLLEYNPRVLVDTMAWAVGAYRARGFQQAFFKTGLSQWLEVVEETLSAESFAEIGPVFRWMTGNVPEID